jgi:hypothetical protein
VTDPGDVDGGEPPSGNSPGMSPWQQCALGVFFLAMGTMIALAAFDLGPMADAQRNAPRWVVAAGGMVFLCGGGLLLFPVRWLGSLLAGVVVFLLTGIFGWVALFGDSAYFVVSSDGFLSAENQVLVARVIFAMVALLGMAILVRAWFWYRRRHRS